MVRKAKSSPIQRGRGGKVLKIEGEWETAAGRAIGKRKPIGGWPTPPKPQKRKKPPS